MSWLKKSSRRKSMFEKEQEVLMENETAVEETCGKTEEKETAEVENNAAEILPAEEAAAQESMEAPAETVAEGGAEEDIETSIVTEENVQAVPEQEAVVRETEDVPAAEALEENSEPEEEEISLECFVESQPEKKDPKEFVLAVVAVVAAVAAVIGLVTVLFRKKKM